MFQFEVIVEAQLKFAHESEDAQAIFFSWLCNGIVWKIPFIEKKKDACRGIYFEVQKPVY